MLNTGVKYCPGCQTRKPHSDFTRNKRRHDGLTNYCRECWSDVGRAQYSKNKDKYRANYLANRAAISARNAARRRANAEELGRPYQERGGPGSPGLKMPCPECGLTFIHRPGFKICHPCRRGEQVPHGTCGTYGRGCRCRLCTDAASANAVNNRRRRLAEAGLPDDNSHKKRARRYGGKYETVNKRLVFQRDNWTCGLCDKPVDKTLIWPDPLSVSLDHITPLSRGGDHTYENVQCSHLRCNQNKQHKIA